MRKSPLEAIPGVGPNIAAHLGRIGVKRISDLVGKDPDRMFEEYTSKFGHVDRCLLYVFRCAVYFANNEKHDPKMLLWWSWKDGPRF